MPQPSTFPPSTKHLARRSIVTIHVNERPVGLPAHEVTGLEIKEEAIAQGVPIEPDFILVEELENGRTRTIGNADHIHVSADSRFLANDGDDNS